MNTSSGQVCKMQNHFSVVAPNYCQLRTTDPEPIEVIARTLKGFPSVRAADIGCGSGRYDLLLFNYINHLHLTLIDNNNSMLEEAVQYLRGHGISNILSIKADANEIPLEQGSMDCIFTMNAVHHWGFLKFIEKSRRIIKKGGRIFIYTRLRSQNAGSVWGLHFPWFAELETRLYELHEMKDWVGSVDSLSIEAIDIFKFKRKTTLDDLIGKVQGKHYSTFSLYDEGVLEEALDKFQENIKKRYSDVNKIEWVDQNILLTLKT